MLYIYIYIRVINKNKNIDGKLEQIIDRLVKMYKNNGRNKLQKDLVKYPAKN
ncbi:hypothetical protein HMPREF1142_1736 [Peptostreptococcaceae bacterium AS15]|nr:hypothetical protein HMPREF1142_1736 [Peptostreptococcaceae bacterium AS15]